MRLDDKLDLNVLSIMGDGGPYQMHNWIVLTDSLGHILDEAQLGRLEALLAVAPGIKPPLLLAASQDGWVAAFDLHETIFSPRFQLIERWRKRLLATPPNIDTTWVESHPGKLLWGLTVCDDTVVSDAWISLDGGAKELRMFGQSLADGATRWELKLPEGKGIGDLAATSNLVVYQTGEGVYARDPHSGDLRWRALVSGSPKGIVCRGALVVAATDQGVVGLDSTSGAVRWRSLVPNSLGVVEGVGASPDLIVVYVRGGIIVGLDPNGKELWRTELQSTSYWEDSPLVAEGTVWAFNCLPARDSPEPSFAIQLDSSTGAVERVTQVPMRFHEQMIATRDHLLVPAGKSGVIEVPIAHAHTPTAQP